MKSSIRSLIAGIAAVALVPGAMAADPRSQEEDRFVCNEDLMDQPLLQGLQIDPGQLQKEEESPAHGCIYAWDIWAQGVAPAAGGGGSGGAVGAPSSPVPQNTLPGNQIVQVTPPAPLVVAPPAFVPPRRPRPPGAGLP